LLFCSGQDHFGPFLADDVFVYLLFDGRGFRDRHPGLLGLFFFIFFSNDVVTQFDALIADIHSRAGDELFDLALALATKRTQKVGTLVSTALTHIDWPPQTRRGVSRGPGFV